MLWGIAVMSLMSNNSEEKRRERPRLRWLNGIGNGMMIVVDWQ
jgi:hypothetical protein